MVRIFIYQKNEEVLKNIQETVIDYFRSVQYTFRVLSCSKYKDAVRYLEKSCEDDDIFLIDFSERDRAFFLVTYLREHNLRASWVYVGGSPSEVFQALSARPSGYIQKPEKPDEILSVIELLKHQHLRMEKKFYFSFKCEGERIRLPYEDISYFESNAKKVVLYQSRSNKRYHFTAKLDDIGMVLPDFFLRCHQSYIVNMYMIRCLDTKNHTFELFSNEEVLISRRMYLQAKTLYEKFSGSVH